MNYLTKLIALTSFLTLAACGQQSPEFLPSSSQIISKQEAKSGTITGTADFGTFAYNATSVKLVTFTVKSDGTDPLVGPASTDNPLFALTYSNCTDPLAKTKSCTLKVSVDPRNLTAGSYSATLKFDTLTLALSAAKDAPPGGSSGNDGYSVLINSEESKTGIDFGSLQGSQSVLKTIYIKNIGSVATPASTAAISSPEFLLLTNQCANKILAPGAQCMLKVSFGSSGLAPNTYTANLTFDTLSTPLTAQVLGSSGGTVVSGPTPEISLLEGVNLALDPIDYGALMDGQNVQKILYIKNTGTVNIDSVNAELTGAHGADYSLVYNQCVNKSLKVSETCQMRLTFSATGKAPGIYGAQLSVASLSFAHNLTAQVLANYQLSVAKKLDTIRSTNLGDLSDGDRLLCLSGACLTKSATYAEGSVVTLH